MEGGRGVREREGRSWRLARSIGRSCDRPRALAPGYSYGKTSNRARGRETYCKSRSIPKPRDREI
eukprot:scaffold268251_cov37-Tisochrysis_lutea.AAC.4